MIAVANRAPLLLLTGLAAAGGFVALARAVARRKTAPIDHEVHDQLAVPDGHPARDVAEKAAPIGKWWTYVPAATLTGAYLTVKRDGASRFAGTAAIVGAAAIAALLNKRFDDAFEQPPAPPGRPSPDHPVFPSGHAFGTSTVALTAAYVLSRERVARGVLAFPVAIAIPLASSVARMAEEKHWISDVIGGHLAAIALSSFALALYEVAAAELDARD